MGVVVAAMALAFSVAVISKCAFRVYFVRLHGLPVRDADAVPPGGSFLERALEARETDAAQAWAGHDAWQRREIAADVIESLGKTQVDVPEGGDGCAICLSAKADSAVIPCGHQCACYACLEAVRTGPDSRCPVCREPIFGVLRIYKCGA